MSPVRVGGKERFTVLADLRRCFWCHGDLPSAWLLSYTEVGGWSAACQTCSDKIWVDAARGAAAQLAAKTAEIARLVGELSISADQPTPR